MVRRRVSSDRSKAAQKRIAKTLDRVNRLKPRSKQAADVIALLKSWLADTSGYDEKMWPKLKKALNKERERVAARRLFDE